MNIQYKEMHTIDIERIKQIYASCNWKSYLQDDAKLLRAFYNSLYCLAAYNQDICIGFIRCVGDGEHIVMVQDLIIDPVYQKNGIGSALFSTIMKRYQDVRMFMLVTDMDDVVDNHFYQSKNFKKIADRNMVAYIR